MFYTAQQSNTPDQSAHIEGAHFLDLAGKLRRAPPSTSSDSTSLSGMLAAAQSRTNREEYPRRSPPLALHATAERQALAKLPARYTISSAGVPIASIQASSATQQPGGAGVLLTWSISPSPQFLKASHPRRRPMPARVDKYLVSLLWTAHSDYLAALQADRVPPSSAKIPLSSWWGVKVKTTTTTNSAMSLQVTAPALPATTTAYTATGVPGERGPVTAASATTAFRDLLYYTK